MNERIRYILNHPLRMPILVGIASFGAGFGVGYILGKRKKFELHVVPNNVGLELTTDELAEIREPRTKPSSDEEDIREPTREETMQEVSDYLAGKLQTPVSELIEDAEIVEEVVDDPVSKNIFANNGDDEWDYAEELKHRSVAGPYILHKDEFYADEKSYSQLTLSYYAGDNILTDDDDTPIYNHENVVGKLQFGHGSGDPNVVYVRNDKNRCEYEIIRLDGLYSVEVLGLEIENNERVKNLKHSGSHRFRMGEHERAD